MAYEAVFTTTDVTLRSTKSGTSSPASIGTDVREIVVDTLPADAVVSRAVLYVTLKDIGASGTNVQTCTVNGVEVRSGGDNVPNENAVRLEIFGNRTVTLTFAYQMNQYVSGTWYTVTFRDITLKIEYDQGEDPGVVDNEVLVPAKGIMLYGPTETDFSKNGLVLHPISCVVTEDAGGSYELQMQAPMDKEDRWTNILEDSLIKAPIPPFKIPETEMPVGKIYRVKSTVTSTPLYSRLPTYVAGKTIPSQYGRWSAAVEYSYGDVCWEYYNDGGTNVQTLFRSGQDQVGYGTGPTDGGVWMMIGPLDPSKNQPGRGKGSYNPGVIIRDLVTLEQITYVATYDSQYVQVRDQYGHVGYALSDKLEQVDTAPQPYIIPARTVYTQLFRIYSVRCDEVEGTVDVSAKHISYDFEGNGIFDCQMIEADPATAIAMLQGRLMNPDLLQYKPHFQDEAEDAESRKRLIACPLTYPDITADWSFQNPVQALLDPDEGFAAQLQAKVLRDNGDFFILPSVPSRIGARLAYGVNLSGVTWERNLDELITRIIPRAGDGDGGFIYLDELFVDSPLINEYAVVHTEVLDSQYSVGQEIELPDGTKRTLGRSEVIERMRQEAENRYYIDGADKVVISLDVEFVLLGDTEEFRQYRNLQRVNLYDKIVIDSGSMTTSAQVVGYEWDCLNARYNGISIGKVYSQARKRLPGYRVATGAITYNKLSPGLIKWIRGSN